LLEIDGATFFSIFYPPPPPNTLAHSQTTTSLGQERKSIQRSSLFNQAARRDFIIKMTKLYFARFPFSASFSSSFGSSAFRPTRQPRLDDTKLANESPVGGNQAQFKF